MNLGITPNINCNGANCGTKGTSTNKQSFGMALKIDSSANSIIKKQAVSLGEKSRNNFIESIRKIAERQKDNPVDILIRKCTHRSALAADIIDADVNDMGTIKNQVTSQRLLFKNGSLKFLKNAEEKANQLNDTNKQVEKLINELG